MTTRVKALKKGVSAKQIRKGPCTLQLICPKYIESGRQNELEGLVIHLPQLRTHCIIIVRIVVLPESNVAREKISKMADQVLELRAHAETRNRYQ